MMTEMEATLAELADRLGLPIDQEGWARIASLRGLWLRYGRAANLVGARSEAALLEHLEDGLATVACVRACCEVSPGLRWVDVGSGGGLPGLLIAALTDCQLALVEPRVKRAAFLEFALGALGRKGAVFRARVDGSTWCENGLVREIVLDKDRFHVATARAVFAPDVWARTGDNLVKNGGVRITHGRPGSVGNGDDRYRAIVRTARSEISAFEVRRH